MATSRTGVSVMSAMRQARWLMAGRAVSAVVGFVMPGVVARTLDPAAFGAYKQLFLLATLALQSLQFGVAQSLYYFIPRAENPSERRAMLAQTTLLLTLLGVVAGGALFLLTPFFSSHFTNPELLPLAVPLALLAAAMVASSPLEVALTASSRPLASAVVLVVSDLVRVAAMVVPLVSGFGLPGLAWGAALATVLRWLLTLALLWRPVGVTRARLASQLEYALPFGLSVLLAMPQQQLHQLLVAAHASPAEFALYSIGCTQLPLVSLLYLPVSETLLVRLARSGPVDAAGLFTEAVDHLALVFLPCCAWIIATGEPAIELVYGRAYVGAAPILRLAILSVAVLSFPVDSVLKARARTGILLTVAAVKTVVTWPLLLLGFHLGGLLGVIGAQVCIEAVFRAFLLISVARELGVRAVSLLGGARLLRTVAVAFITGLAARVAVLAATSPLWACVAGTSAAFVVVAWELRARRLAAPLLQP